MCFVRSMFNLTSKRCNFTGFFVSKLHNSKRDCYMLIYKSTMVLCCVSDCSSRWETDNTNITHHAFPANDEIKRKWMNVIKVNGPVTKALVCSKHFLPSDYYVVNYSGRDLKMLKEDAVPSVFEITFCRGSQIHKGVPCDCVKTVTLANTIVNTTTAKQFSQNPKINGGQLILLNSNQSTSRPLIIITTMASNTTTTKSTSTAKNVTPNLNSGQLILLGANPSTSGSATGIGGDKTATKTNTSDKEKDENITGNAVMPTVFLNNGLQSPISNLSGGQWILLNTNSCSAASLTTTTATTTAASINPRMANMGGGHLILLSGIPQSSTSANDVSATATVFNPSKRKYPGKNKPQTSEMHAEKNTSKLLILDEKLSEECITERKSNRNNTLKSDTVASNIKKNGSECRSKRNRAILKDVLLNSSSNGNGSESTIMGNKHKSQSPEDDQPARCGLIYWDVSFPKLKNSNLSSEGTAQFYKNHVCPVESVIRKQDWQIPQQVQEEQKKYKERIAELEKQVNEYKKQCDALSDIALNLHTQNETRKKSLKVYSLEKNEGETIYVETDLEECEVELVDEYIEND